MNAEWIGRYIRKSRASIDEAQKCLEMGIHRAAIVRAYYGLYQAANAWMDLRGYHRSDTSRLNWHHNEVHNSWSQVLQDIGVDDLAADAVYNTAQSFRVRVEYQTGPEPSPRDAEKSVDLCRHYSEQIWVALKKEGHNGDR